MIDSTILDYIELGRNAYAAREFDTAEAMLKQAADKASRTEHSYQAVAIVLENLALIYVQKHRYGKAERLLRRSIELHEQGMGNVNNTHSCRLTYKLAHLYLTQSKPLLADEVTEKAIEIGKNCQTRDRQMEIDLLLRLAMIWEEDGHYSKAIDLYQVAVELRNQLN